MTAPVFDGDTIYSQSTILQATEYPNHADKGLVSVLMEVFNQNDKLVSKIHLDILIYKKGKHPSDQVDKTAEKKTVSEPRFHAYRELNDGTLIEQVGLYYEDFNPGEIFEHRPGKTITLAENLEHSLRSLDWNPMYVDFAYINKVLGGKHRVNEHYVLGASTAESTRTFGRVVANLGWKDIELPQEIYVGDTFYAESEIMSKRESHSRPTQGILTAKTRAFNQHGDLVLSYIRTFLVYKKASNPFESAGY